MSSVSEIFEAAQSLPAGERAWLIEALWDTMESTEWAPPSDEWIAEAERRSRLLDEGQMAVLPWAEVREQARRKAAFDGCAK